MATGIQEVSSFGGYEPRVKALSKDVPEKSDYWGDNGLDFWDLLDVINPLQHIPLVSDAYRRMTGDEISPGARMVGGAVYGGPVGLISAVAGAVMRQETGTDAGEYMVASIMGDDTQSLQESVIANASSDTEGHPTAPTVPVTQRTLDAPRELVSFPDYEDAQLKPETATHTAGERLPWLRDAVELAGPSPMRPLPSIVDAYSYAPYRDNVHSADVVIQA